MNTKQITYPIRDRWSYLWLLIGTAMTLSGTGQWTIPLLIWLWGSCAGGEKSERLW